MVKIHACVLARYADHPLGGSGLTGNTFLNTFFLYRSIFELIAILVIYLHI